MHIVIEYYCCSIDIAVLSCASRVKFIHVTLQFKRQYCVSDKIVLMLHFHTQIYEDVNGGRSRRQLWCPGTAALLSFAIHFSFGQTVRSNLLNLTVLLFFGQNSFKVLISSSSCISFIGFYRIACNSSLFVVASIGFTRLDRLNRFYPCHGFLSSHNRLIFRASAQSAKIFHDAVVCGLSARTRLKLLIGCHDNRRGRRLPLFCAGLVLPTWRVTVVLCTSERYLM